MFRRGYDYVSASYVSPNQNGNLLIISSKSSHNIVNYHIGVGRRYTNVIHHIFMFFFFSLKVSK